MDMLQQCSNGAGLLSTHSGQNYTVVLVKVCRYSELNHGSINDGLAKYVKFQIYFQSFNTQNWPGRKCGSYQRSPILTDMTVTPTAFVSMCLVIALHVVSYFSCLWSRGWRDGCFLSIVHRRLQQRSCIFTLSKYLQRYSAVRTTLICKSIEMQHLLSFFLLLFQFCLS